MKASSSRPLFAVGLLVCLLAACQSELPTSPTDDSQSISATASGEPDFLLGGLLGGRGGAKPTLIKVRRGETLTADDAKLSFLESALSFPTQITQEVDGNRYVSFRFGPNGLAFDPVAILSISVDKADLRGVNPWKLRIAVASDDRDDWRVVGGIYNPLTRTVVAPVLHFSRYALCVE
ncbi:MAG TPA: hypothetical protein VIE39_02285 [Thermoanaerobaculia bacterium]